MKSLEECRYHGNIALPKKVPYTISLKNCTTKESPINKIIETQHYQRKAHKQYH
jgi:hypothetical protein